MHGTISPGEAKERARSIPIEDIHVGDPALFASDSHWPYFDGCARKTRSTTAAKASSAPIGR